jgi:hypothetical protein
MDDESVGRIDCTICGICLVLLAHCLTLFALFAQEDLLLCCVHLSQS